MVVFVIVVEIAAGAQLTAAAKMWAEFQGAYSSRFRETELAAAWLDVLCRGWKMWFQAPFLRSFQLVEAGSRGEK